MNWLLLALVSGMNASYGVTAQLLHVLVTIVISVASSEYGVPLTTMNEKAKGKQHTQTCGQVDLRFWWRLSQQTIFGSRHIAVATRTHIMFGFLTWLRWIIVAAHLDS